MSDVVVSVTESTTNVTVTEPTVAVDVTENVVQVSATSAGIQGATGPQGASYTPGDPIYVTVRNATGSTITKGQIVYTSGGNGVHTQVSLALATSDATSARVLGWMAEDVANNASGLCQVEGYLDGVNTQSIAEGTQLYLSGTTAGSFQTSKPQAPVHLVYVGVAVKASAGNGKVYVKVQNGYELDELHDVQITSKTNNDLIKYDSATSLWKNVQPSSLTVGTATYATTSGTALTSGTAFYATSSTYSGTATYASTSGTAVYAGTAANAGAATNALYATNAGDATTAQTAVSLSGTVTQSQVTSLTTDLANRAKLDTANTFSVGGHVITNEAIGTVPLVLKGFSGQTGDLLQIQNNGATNLAVVSSSGTFRTAGLITAGNVSNVLGQLTVYTTVASRIGAVIQGAASQSADLLQIQNSGGTVLTKVGSTGDLTTGYVYGSGLRDTAGSGPYINTTTTNVLLNARTATNKGLVIQGAASQSANLLELQTSDGVLQTAFNSIGYAQIGAGTNPGGQLGIPLGSASNRGIVIRGAASQTANLQEWQDSSGGTAIRIASNGLLSTSLSPAFAGLQHTSGQGAYFAFNNDTGSVTLFTNAAANKGLVVKGAASQSSDLTQWQNSGGTVLAKVDSAGGASFASGNASITSAGVIRGIQTATNNDYVTLREANSGGYIRITKQTAATPTQSTNQGSLYFRDGTNAGTLKLVVRAGAAGAETTILDNIPQ